MSTATPTRHHATKPPQPDETALAGADLAEAVAWVMMPTPKDDGTVHIEAGTCYVCWELEGGALVEFRPDLGGADAWAVLEWVHDTGRTVSLMRTTSPNGQHTHWADLYGAAAATITGRGETAAIALCRAVAQMRRLTEVAS